MKLLEAFIGEPLLRTFTLILYALLLAADGMASTTYADLSPGLPLAIPDNSAAGVSRSLVVGDVGTLTALSLTLSFSPQHTWAGDLIITLSDGTVSADILRRVGARNAGNFGDSSNLSGSYTFIDSGSNLPTAIAAIGSGTALANGSYQASTNIFSGNAATNPAVLLDSVFAGRSSAATWTLFVSDNAGGDTGSLSGWSLTLTTAESSVPEPGSAALIGLGLVAIGLITRRGSRKTRNR